MEGLGLAGRDIYTGGGMHPGFGIFNRVVVISVLLFGLEFGPCWRRRQGQWREPM